MPFGDHPLKLERYKEDQHGLCAKGACQSSPDPRAPQEERKREKKKNANEKRKDMQIYSSGPIDADLEEKKIFRREQLENETFKDRNMFFHTSHQGSHQGC